MGTGWSRLETPGEQFDPRGRNLSWEYSDATVSYEGSYLVVTSGSDGNTVKEDKEGGQADRVHLVHRGGLDHRDLQDLKDRWDLKGR